MSEAILVFVDGRPLSVPPGTTALSAVAALDASLSGRVQEGKAYLTDGRGIRVEAGEPVFQGAIIRVVVTARAQAPGANGHA